MNNTLHKTTDHLHIPHIKIYTNNLWFRNSPFRQKR